MDFKQYIIFLIIPLMVLVIFGMINYGPTGFFEKIKGAVDSVVTIRASFGMKELQAEAVSLGKGQVEEMDSLRAALERMVTSTKSDCFSKFSGFAEDLGDGEKSTAISMSYDAAQQVTFFQIDSRLGQSYSLYNISKMRPCVIAGPNNVVQNFKDHFNKGGSLQTPYYSAVNGVKIYYQENGWNGNAIRVTEWGEQYLNHGDNFQNDGYVFKGNNNEICFFPTNDVFNNQNGLNDDLVINKGDKESIAYKYAHGQLTKCD